MIKDIITYNIPFDFMSPFAQHCAKSSNLEQCARTWTAQQAKISVLLDRREAERFDAYCKEKGFKRSSFFARLIRDHLIREGYRAQENLFPDQTDHSPDHP